MIDRTRPNAPLTARWLQIAFLISGGLFAFLIAMTILFWLIGVLAWIACWLWILLAYVVLYILALLPVIIAFGILAGASENSGSDNSGAGCAGFIMLLVLIWFYDTWSWWSTLTAEATSIMNTTSVWAYDAYMALYEVAGKTWDVFVVNEVYFWSWIVLAAGLSVTLAYVATLGLARTDAPLRRVTAAVRFQCPRCKTRAVVHRCPKCDEKHPDLAPTRHGIWKAQCDKCPTPLGTTGWTGLLSVPRDCSGCGHAMTHPDLGKLPEFHIALIGGRGSGKSTLLTAAIAFLEDTFGPTHGLKITYESSAAERDIRNRLHLYGTGEPQRVTQLSERPAAVMLSAQPTGGGGGFLLYLYDASGEDLEAGDTGARPGISGHDFHEFIDAAILAVDPTAEEGLRTKAGVTARGGHGAYEVLTRMIGFWQRRRGVAAGGRFRFPLALVVTKLDTGSLAAEVGSYPELSKRMSSTSDLAAESISTSDKVRRLLTEAGENDLIQLAESHFMSVGYFGVSAQGRPYANGNRTGFRPQAAFAPFAWLLVQCGAITTAPGLVRATTRSLRYFGRCLRGVEGKPARRYAWASIILAALIPVVLIWWYLGVVWAAVALVFAVLGLGIQSYRSRETG